MVRDLRHEHISAIIGSMSDTQQAANRLLSLLTIMLRHAVANRWIAHNPTAAVDGFRKKTKGFHTWTETEIAAYEGTPPEGSKASSASPPK